MIDLFISTGEPSGDLQGSKLIQSLLLKESRLKIGAVAGPKMRALPIESIFQMESLQVMGFVDVLFALPKIVKQFFRIRNKILELNPKAVVCIDYPGFHLAMEKSLRKKGFKGKLIHFISPTVWAWKKNRIYPMEKYLDLLLTIFPFEKAYFAKTSLPVEYVGHPLVLAVDSFVPSLDFKGAKILSIFPGSRKKEIERNLPLQLKTARKLKSLDPLLEIVISIAHPEFETQIKTLAGSDISFISSEKNYDLMKASHLSLATSGTVTLELALHKTPAIVGFAIKPLDLFLAQKIFRINLPFYCIVNIICSKEVFPELFGPYFNEETLFTKSSEMWFDSERRKRCFEGCQEVRKSLGVNDAANKAAEAIFSLVDF